MPTILRKVIARRGVVVPKNPLGKRVVKTIDDKWIDQLVKSGNEMLADGLLIPAPYGHTDDNSVHPVPLVRSDSGALLDAKTGEPSRWDHAVNAGFWTGFEVSQGPTPENPDERPGDAVGLLEVEGDENDPETHAGRIGTTFRQTSPFVADWVDGSGKKRINAPLHICITNRAVQNGQPNFKKVSDKSGPKATHPGTIAKNEAINSAPELAIAMSLDDSNGQETFSFINYKFKGELDVPFKNQTDSKPRPKKSDERTPESPSGSNPNGTSDSNTTNSNVSDSDDSNSGGELGEDNNEDEAGNISCTMDPAVVQNIVGLVEEKLGISFPENTTPQNFMDRLLTILTSLDSSEDYEEEGEEASSRIKQPPKGSEAYQAPTVMSLDPANNPDDLVVLQKQHETLGSLSTGLLKTQYRTRVDAALKAGKIGKKRAEHLRKRIEALQLSLDGLELVEGIPQTAIELDLSDIEESVGLLDPDKGGPENGYIPSEADDMGEGPEAAAKREPTDAEVEEVLNRSLPRFSYSVGRPESMARR